MYDVHVDVRAFDGSVNDTRSLCTMHVSRKKNAFWKHRWLTSIERKHMIQIYRKTICNNHYSYYYELEVLATDASKMHYVICTHQYCYHVSLSSASSLLHHQYQFYFCKIVYIFCSFVRNGLCNWLLHPYSYTMISCMLRHRLHLRIDWI